MTDRERRAIARRATWLGEVVTNGAIKEGLYTDLSREDRLKSLARLNQQVQRTTGLETLPVIPRSEWQGEIFEVSRHDIR